MNKLTPDDLKVGHGYSAKQPKVIGILHPMLNDRMILWIDRYGERLQYDSPTVANGRLHPMVTFDQFLRFAKVDVTDQCPKNEWRSARKEQS